MSKCIWATDLHLDHATSKAFHRFIDEVKAYQADVLLLAGDIAQSSNLQSFLSQIDNLLQIPIFFVLGNHDFYGSSLDDVRQNLKAFVATRPNLHYLTQAKNPFLIEHTAVIGDDGWADGLAGDFLNSTVMLNDYLLIKDFQGLSTKDRGDKLFTLGKESTLRVEQKLKAALEQTDHVLLITHVPPFQEGALFQDRPSGPEWAPHFVCEQMGKMLTSIMVSLPNKHLTVLAGHAHHRASYQPLPNMTCLTGHADYGYPMVQGKLALS